MGCIMGEPYRVEHGKENMMANKEQKGKKEKKKKKKEKPKETGKK